MRLSLVLMFVVCTIIPAGAVFAQNDLENPGGTVRGQITDTTEIQSPIEGVRVVIVAQSGMEYTTTTDANGDYEHTRLSPGRYLVSIYKEGYGDRLGKPVTVVNGGDHYVPLKMTKKEGIGVFFRTFGVVFWIIFFCAITALLTYLFTKRTITEKYESNRRR